MCEEAEEPYRYGAINKGKDRYISGIVSPAAPHYVYGLINETQVPVSRHLRPHAKALRPGRFGQWHVFVVPDCRMVPALLAMLVRCT